MAGGLLAALAGAGTKVGELAEERISTKLRTQRDITLENLRSSNRAKELSQSYDYDAALEGMRAQAGMERVRAQGEEQRRTAGLRNSLAVQQWNRERQAEVEHALRSGDYEGVRSDGSLYHRTAEGGIQDVTEKVPFREVTPTTGQRDPRTQVPNAIDQPMPGVSIAEGTRDVPVYGQTTTGTPSAEVQLARELGSLGMSQPEVVEFLKGKEGLSREQTRKEMAKAVLSSRMAENMTEEEVRAMTNRMVALSTGMPLYESGNDVLEAIAGGVIKKGDTVMTYMGDEVEITEEMVREVMEAIAPPAEASPAGVVGASPAGVVGAMKRAEVEATPATPSPHFQGELYQKPSKIDPAWVPTDEPGVERLVRSRGNRVEVWEKRGGKIERVQVKDPEAQQQIEEWNRNVKEGASAIGQWLRRGGEALGRNLSGD